MVCLRITFTQTNHMVDVQEHDSVFSLRLTWESVLRRKLRHLAASYLFTPQGSEH